MVLKWFVVVDSERRKALVLPVPSDADFDVEQFYVLQVTMGSVLAGSDYVLSKDLDKLSIKDFNWISNVLVGFDNIRYGFSSIGNPRTALALFGLGMAFDNESTDFFLSVEAEVEKFIEKLKSEGYEVIRW